jgi:hypothetical protein
MYGRESPHPEAVGIGRMLEILQSVYTALWVRHSLQFLKAQVAKRGSEEGNDLIQLSLWDSEGEVIERHCD